MLMKIPFRNRLGIILTVCLCAFCIPTVSSGQTAPVIGLHENTPNVTAFTNVRIVVSPKTVIEDATLVARDGSIESVGRDIDIPPDAVVHSLEGKTIYPGFIDLYTHYGIPEKLPDSTDTVTLHWNAAVRPERNTAGLFQADEKDSQALRKSGFTTVLSFPGKGIFRGEGALILLNDSEPNQAVLKENTAQSLALHGRSDDYPRSLQGRIALIRQTLLDTQWYSAAWKAYTVDPGGQKAPEVNLSLAALKPYADGVRPVVIETSGVYDIFRGMDIANEYGLNVWFRGNGYEYRRLTAVKNAAARLIIPINFPEPPDVSTDETSLRVLRHWDFAPENPARLSHAGIDFSLTTSGAEKKEDFLKNLRTAVKYGLLPDKALKALTITPAEWLNMTHLLGTLEKGKIANLIITDGDIFEDTTKILDTWVAGKQFEINPVPEVDIRGTWALRLTPNNRIGTMELEISGEQTKPVVKAVVGDKTVKALDTAIDKRLVMYAFHGDSLGYEGVIRMTGMMEKNMMLGHGTWGDGAVFQWEAKLTKPWQAEPDTTEVKAVDVTELQIVYPEGAFGRTTPDMLQENILIKNATLWTSGPDGIIENSDMLVKKGEIDKIGRNLKAPKDAVIIDATGKYITPGLIDAHSHLAITGGINEGTHAITSETRISDVIDPGNINIYRQLAGGLTMACIIHGSANPIGGQNAVIKLRWGALPQEMLMDSARPGIKFALGENVKRSNVPGPVTTRYPISRMGVEQFMRDSFQAAKDYRQELLEYEKKKKKRKNCIPPRRDLRLEPLVEVLAGERQIQCHSYRQDEILSMIHVADEMGFKVEVLIHILEGYKVADVMRKHGAMPTAFSDWWAYKFEVYDAIPYNGAIMHDQGLLVSFNSDDIELARRMNLEAAKAVKYGGVPEEEALKFVTLNPAIQLGVGDRTGSLEPGKDADFVIWNGPPLSTYSICEQTWIDGCKYFDIEEDRSLREKVKQERNALVHKVLSKGKEKKKEK